MARLLKAPGSAGASRLLVAEFDGYVRDGATFQLLGSPVALGDGDLIAFRSEDGIRPGLTVGEDEQGLHSLVRFGPSTFLRMALEAQGGGVYAFRPASHHVELWPELGPDGAGAKMD